MRKKKFYRKAVYEHHEALFPFLLDPKMFRGWLEKKLGSKKLVVEFGSGTGDFLVQQAIQDPGTLFLAVEIKPDRLYLSFKKAEKHGLKNIVFLQTDIKKIPDYNLPEVEKIYLLFSDPWPKNRHSDRRLSSSGFLNIYKNILSPKGELVLKTDSRHLFDFSLENLRVEQWEVIEQQGDYKTPDEETTAFERRFRTSGRPIYYIQAHPPNNKDNFLENITGI